MYYMEVDIISIDIILPFLQTFIHYCTWWDMASDIAGLGGYECDFVELPPAELLCLICTLVAREPMQVSCCGKVYCKACLTELKKHSRKCPNCRMEAIGFPDRRSKFFIKRMLRGGVIHVYDCGKKSDANCGLLYTYYRLWTIQWNLTNPDRRKCPD